MRMEEAEEVLAETLAWLLYYGPRRVAEYASEVAWLLVAYGLLDRKRWERESARCAKERGDAFLFPNPFGEDGSPPPSSPSL